MERVIEADEAVVEAVRAAALEAGVEVRDGVPTPPSTWWRAGLGEALDRGALEPPTTRYGATPPPRRTRGATRA